MKTKFLLKIIFTGMLMFSITNLYANKTSSEPLIAKCRLVFTNHHSPQIELKIINQSKKSYYIIQDGYAMITDISENTFIKFIYPPIPDFSVVLPLVVKSAQDDQQFRWKTTGQNAHDDQSNNPSLILA